MATQIQIRRDTAANWTADNPILAQAEPALELDTGKLKLGDGTTAWTSLAYLVLTIADLEGMLATRINVRGAWTATTGYAVNDFVSIASGTYAGGFYLCLTAHTSGSTFTGAGANWECVGVTPGTFDPIGRAVAMALVLGG